jgi:hypothetical protein
MSSLPTATTDAPAPSPKAPADLTVEVTAAAADDVNEHMHEIVLFAYCCSHCSFKQESGDSDADCCSGAESFVCCRGCRGLDAESRGSGMCWRFGWEEVCLFPCTNTLPCRCGCCGCILYGWPNSPSFGCCTSLSKATAAAPEQQETMERGAEKV